MPNQNPCTFPNTNTKNDKCAMGDITNAETGKALVMEWVKNITITIQLKINGLAPLLWRSKYIHTQTRIKYATKPNIP